MTAQTKRYRTFTSLSRSLILTELRTEADFRPGLPNSVTVISGVTGNLEPWVLAERDLEPSDAG